MKSELVSSTKRKACYGILSFVIGLWTFKKVNEISGPSFAPIVEACTNPELTSMYDFVEKTGYHEYEPIVGLGVFKVLVCLITQFLLELRSSYPEGLLVWWGVLVSSFPFILMSSFESGRDDVSKYSPIRYPILIGLLSQLLGVSVIVPLLWIPGYVLGFGCNPVSDYRFKCTIPQFIPGFLLSLTVFTADTSSRLWTVAAGTLGGPILALSSFVFWADQTPPLSNENMQHAKKKIKSISKGFALFSAIIWWALVLIAIQGYSSFDEFLNKIWIEGNASVKFMVIDTLILYVAVLLWVAFHDELMAIKAFLLTPFIGFGAAPLLCLGAIEDMKAKNIDFENQKKDI